MAPISDLKPCCSALEGFPIAERAQTDGPGLLQQSCLTCESSWASGRLRSQGPSHEQHHPPPSAAHLYSPLFQINAAVCVQQHCDYRCLSRQQPLFILSLTNETFLKILWSIYVFWSPISAVTVKRAGIRNRLFIFCLTSKLHLGSVYVCR